MEIGQTGLNAFMELLAISYQPEARGSPGGGI